MAGSLITRRNWSYEFLRNLNKKDWVALITYDLRPHIEVDFTQNHQEIAESTADLMFPGFHEANTFDALLDTLDRMQDVKGKKSVLLLASGFDTFSRHTLDQTLKRLKNTDVTIFCVGIGEELFVRSVRDGGVSLSAGQESAEYFCEVDRRVHLVSAF